MTKLCPRGKAAAKRKFKVYPSAYANAYASKICAGKIKDPSGVKRKDFRGSKAEGGLMEATARLKRQGLKSGRPMKEDRAREGKKAQYKKMGFGQLMKEGTIDFGDKNPILKKKKEKQKKYENPKKDERFNQAFKDRMKTMGLGNIAGDSRLAKGGRAGLKGGGICKRGMNRKAVGKNS